LDRLQAEFEGYKKRELYKLNDDRKAQYREDVLAPRVVINDGKEHVAGCQTFIGNDLGADQRAKIQKEQMKVWIQEQVFQKEELKREQKHEEKYLLISTYYQAIHRVPTSTNQCNE
jgi:hypothetical protein